MNIEKHYYFDKNGKKKSKYIIGGCMMEFETLLVDNEKLKKLITKELSSNKAFFYRLFDFFKTHLQDFSSPHLDPALRARLAHKISSSCRTLGALKLEEVCRQIETSFHNGELENVSSLTQRAVELIEPTITEIDGFAEDFFNENEF